MDEFERATELGYIGPKTDPLPDESYSVASAELAARVKGLLINSNLDAADATLLEITAAYSGTIVVVKPGSVLISPDQLFLTVPTTDPGIAGQVWNDEGTLKVSAGVEE